VVPIALSDVGVRGQSGKHLLGLSISHEAVFIGCLVLR
jgi:hypothetical protein